ncbi:signal peptidase I [Aestuariispira ectoiniformans]|uniref:signal peptidase I n=1 Tax=Aestuariispira ectoiniformans TaxID=2775080 RepID=UPI0028831888|nr:signal peptidase I [Aestuariispira ectoiniformans]
MKKDDENSAEAKENTAGDKAKKVKQKGDSLGETLRTLVWAILIAVGVRTFFFEPFNIPSGSMIPTLLIGDYMFVNKMTYGYGRYSFPFGLVPFEGRIFGSEPERGDVAVFRHPNKPGVDYVKRIIGLPGDRIQMISGVLHINGEPVKRRRVEDYVLDPETNMPKSVKQYVETLPNGVTHNIIETHGDNWIADNTKVYVVPEGYFFAMGDNRDNSSDSRFLDDLGFVPMGNLIGKASVFFYSADSTVSLIKPWTWLTGTRYSRLFDGIE